MNSTNYDPADTIADGLAVFVVATNDDSATEDVAALYRLLSRKIRETMRPGDTCRLALPAMIVMPNLRTACFVAVLHDRVLVIYERGRFHKTAEAITIPTSRGSDVHRHTGTTSSTRGVSLVTITGRGGQAGAECGSPNATIALPPQTVVAAASAIREALNPARR